MGLTSILVVEDDRILNQVLVASLEAKGYIVESADCGEEALEMIRNKEFQAVITDYRLGKVNGDAVIRGCKTKDSRTLAIMITGVVSEEIQEKAMTAGADAFFFKPVKIETLLKHLPPQDSSQEHA